MNSIIRPLRQTDAADILAIYAPYVTDTTITFETEVRLRKNFRKGSRTFNATIPISSARSTEKWSATRTPPNIASARPINTARKYLFMLHRITTKKGSGRRCTSVCSRRLMTTNITVPTLASLCRTTRVSDFTNRSGLSKSEYTITSGTRTGNGWMSFGSKSRSRITGSRRGRAETGKTMNLEAEAFTGIQRLQKLPETT